MRKIFTFIVLIVALVLSSSPILAMAGLDWAEVEWINGELNRTYTMANGVDITIDIQTSAAGSFDFPNGDGVLQTPYIDGKDPNPSFFGTALDLGVIFNPDAGQGASPVIITISFTEPVTDLVFEISDIDWSPAGTVGGSEQDQRVDQVVFSSDNGLPILEPLEADPSFKCAEGDSEGECTGDTVTAELGTDSSDSVPDNSDRGTVRASFPQPVSVVTLTYNEGSGEDDPSSRGIGVLATLSQVPVELISFSVE